MTPLQSTSYEVGEVTRNEAEQLFLENTALAYHILHKDFPTFAQSEDMKQEALLGLWRACISFDPSKGKFSTYAGCCILNAIRYALRGYQKQPETVSLNQPISEEGSTLEDLLEDPYPSVDEGLIDLVTFLKGLPERERKLIQCRLDGLTQNQISAEMGLSQTWCSRILKKMRQEYLKQEEY